MFEGCNSLSKMRGNVLSKSSQQGVSFDVIETQTPMIISVDDTDKSDKLDVGSNVQFMLY